MGNVRTYFRCEKCGNFVGLIHSGDGTLVCCGSDMKQLRANTTDAAQEKHVPALSLNGETLTVQVGSTLHPMTVEHYIQWIAVAQGNKTQRIALTPKDEPKAAFSICKDGGAITVYEYCNLHGLWKAEITEL